MDARTTHMPKTPLPKAVSADARIRVGVAGMAPMFAIGLASLLHDSPKVEIVQADILEMLRDPALCIMMLGAHSDAALLQLMATVRVYREDVRMIVLSAASTEESILKVIAAGAKGHVHEAATIAEVEQAIQIVASGSVWAPRRVLSMLIERLTCASPTSGSIRAALTKREREVLELLIAGHPNKAIAQTLGIGEQTVKAYVSKLMRKVGVQSRTALTMHAVEHAWLDTSRSSF